MNCPKCDADVDLDEEYETNYNDERIYIEYECPNCGSSGVVSYMFIEIKE